MSPSTVTFLGVRLVGPKTTYSFLEYSSLNTKAEVCWLFPRDFLMNRLQLVEKAYTDVFPVVVAYYFNWYYALSLLFIFSATQLVRWRIFKSTKNYTLKLGSCGSRTTPFTWRKFVAQFVLDFCCNFRVSCRSYSNANEFSWFAEIGVFW